MTLFILYPKTWGNIYAKGNIRDASWREGERRGVGGNRGGRGCVVRRVHRLALHRGGNAAEQGTGVGGGRTGNGGGWGNPFIEIE